VAAYRRPADLL